VIRGHGVAAHEAVFSVAIVISHFECEGFIADLELNGGKTTAGGAVFVAATGECDEDEEQRAKGKV